MVLSGELKLVTLPWNQKRLQRFSTESEGTYLPKMTYLQLFQCFNGGKKLNKLVLINKAIEVANVIWIIPYKN